MTKIIELLIIIAALNIGQLNAQNKLTSDTTTTRRISYTKIITEAENELTEEKKKNAEKDKEIAEQDKEIAEQNKKIAEQSIKLIGQISQIFLLERKVTDEERKISINCIASVKFYKHLLKDEADYTEKMKKHNDNVTFLKKELNITEQEIQTEMKIIETKVESHIEFIDEYASKIKEQNKSLIIYYIANVKLYNNLLKNRANYQETMIKFKNNVTFLKKELNITEQEIQTEMKKLEK